MSQSPKSNEATSSGVQSKLLLLVTGILVPLLAVAVPYLIDLVSPKSALVFEAIGPIQVETTRAFSVVVRNEGKSVEKNIEVWLPAKLQKGAFKLESSSNVNMRDDGKATVLQLGDLRPSEKAEVSLLVDDRMFFLWEHRIKDLRIVSSDTRATWSGRTEEEFFLYRAGAWAFIIIMVVAIAAGLYQEHFMSRAAREKMILKEMEKLK